MQWTAPAIRVILPIDSNVTGVRGSARCGVLEDFKLSGKTLTFQTHAGPPPPDRDLRLRDGDVSIRCGQQSILQLCGWRRSRMPEPNSVLLMAVGLASLVLVHRANAWRS